MSKSINILIVEDNVLTADDMQMILEDMGYNVVANVTSYEKAIDALNNNTIDLALLDIQLATEKSGIDVGEYIREKFDIPFVFVTSNSSYNKDVKGNIYEVNKVFNDGTFGCKSLTYITCLHPPLNNP